MKENMIQDGVWQQLLRATQMIHYSKRMGRRMARAHRWVRIVPLSFAFAGGGALLLGQSTEIWIELGITILVVTAMVLDYA